MPLAFTRPLQFLRHGMRREEQIFEFGRIESAADWLAPVAAVAALATYVWWLYRRDGAELRLAVRLFLVACRTTVLAALCWVVLDPRMRTEILIERSSRVAILADGSQSMTIADADATGASTETRHNRMVRLLTNEGLLAALRRRHEVALYRFGRVLVPMASLSRDPQPEASVPDDWRSSLTAVDDQTRLGSAIEGVLRRESQFPLAGVVVLSDGAANAGDSTDAAVRQARRTKAPIHTVGFGDAGTPINVRIADVAAPARAFRGDEIKVRVEVRATGAAGRTFSVELLASEPGSQPRPLGRRDVTFADDRTPRHIEIPYTPEQFGRVQLLARVPPDPQEARLQLHRDNELGRTLEVVDRRTKVLLFAGGPGREYQFLRNLLYRDKSVELTILLQSAAGPVAQEADALLMAFPEQREKLFEYDVIVAIDADWTVVPDSSRQLLREWVDRHAGGLVLLAGPVFTARVARDETLLPLRALAPVVFQESSPLEAAALRSEPVGVAPTAEGLASGLVSLDDDVERSRQAWETLGVYSVYPVSSVKPGASVLARLTTAPASTGTAPVFVTQYFGSGRVFFSATSEIWRLRKPGETIYDRFWIRLIRELGQGRLLRGGSRGTLLLDAERFPLGSEVRIGARLVDESFRPLAAETVPLAVIDPTGKRSEIDLVAEAGRPGQFAGTLVPLAVGTHRLQLLVPRSTEVIDRALDVRPPDLEFADPGQNRTILEGIAAATGGRYLTADQAGQLAELLPDRSETQVLAGPIAPLWDRAWLMLALAGLLSVEWLVRKLCRLA